MKNSLQNDMTRKLMIGIYFGTKSAPNKSLGKDKK